MAKVKFEKGDIVKIRVVGPTFEEFCRGDCDEHFELRYDYAQFMEPFVTGRVIGKVEHVDAEDDSVLVQQEGGIACGAWYTFKEVVLASEAKVEAPAIASEQVAAVFEQAVIESAPAKGKAVYAVIRNGEMYHITTDRELAREIKSGLGGKKNGAEIIQYAAVKEIR